MDKKIYIYIYIYFVNEKSLNILNINGNQHFIYVI